ncbi:MAG: heparinase II/III-family protein [Gammaproteobacteria bacterium]|nr:heparinase II/III-family protein [Gammaproteobacteria bacterium]
MLPAINTPLNNRQQPVHPAVTPEPEYCPTEITQLKESGYIRLSSGNAIAFLDVAPVGPDYLPGHAHADTLSFELSVFGRRVIVNGGTSRYGVGPERLRERETRSHSTVEVGGESSSEVWSSFRVARRAKPFALGTRETANYLEVSCRHDGYTRLPGKPIHSRNWRMRTAGLQVIDSVSGKLPALARFILHPDIGIDALEVNTWTLHLHGEKSLNVLVTEGISHIEAAWYAPEFGKVLPTQCLVVDLIQGQAVTTFSW